MADSPSKNKDGILSYSVYCKGKKIKDDFVLVSAFVHVELNRIGKATLKFNAGDMDKQTFDESDSDSFKPGNAILLSVGNIDTEQNVFEGVIIGIRITVGNDCRSYMIVECRDCAYAATESRKNRIFENKPDSDIIKQVLLDYGTVKVDSTSYSHPTLVQYYCTDWDFALSRADANGLFIYTKGKQINVCKPNISATAVLTVTFGIDMIGFDLELSGSDQYTQYEAVSWSPNEQKVIKVSASSPLLNKQGDLQPKSIAAGGSMLLQTDAPTDEKALKQWVNSMALKAGLARYRGTCSFYGTAKVVPGCVIELKGLGRRFNGNMFVGSVTHTIENNEWLTEVGAGISPLNITDEVEVVTPAASGIIPGLEGLHTAIVKKLNSDPKKEYRIQVELPWMNGTKKELWARFSTMYASNGSGNFFMPEVGDEVVVGFMNQDPGHPVVLGGLYGKKHKPPYEYEAKNGLKAIVTREKMKIEFDEQKKVITISTPAGNKVEINDQAKSVKLADQYKNEIVMNSGGISLSSIKDITLKAKGNINIDAMIKTTIAAKSDVTVDGMNVKVNAKVGASVKGNATVELSASGRTVVKGAIVMIN